MSATNVCQLIILVRSLHMFFFRQISIFNLANRCSTELVAYRSILHVVLFHSPMGL